MILEVDKNKFRKINHNRGHRVNGVWVFEIVEWYTRRIILLLIPNRNSKTLMTIIEKLVKSLV